jgi:hypothetical protein
MTPFVTAGAGFLLAVLWFDLMFDVQALPHRRRELPEHTLASNRRLLPGVPVATARPGAVALLANTRGRIAGA